MTLPATRAIVTKKSFEDRYQKLTGAERGAVNTAVCNLAMAEVLPGDDDITDIIPPGYPCFARPIPGTDVRIVYEFSSQTGAVFLRMLRTTPEGRLDPYP